MREDPIKADFAKDPLKYWSEKTGDPFARMGLDFMSAPATSVDVERAFSRGSLTVSKHRHSLSDRSTRAAIIMSSWTQIPGVVIESDVLEALQEKAGRLAKGGTSEIDVIEVDDD